MSIFTESLTRNLFPTKGHMFPHKTRGSFLLLHTLKMIVAQMAFHNSYK